MAYALSVIVVPGYGLAVAQARRAVRDSPSCSSPAASWVERNPAGCGPHAGDMNVLLAEANVPYPQLKEMDDINPEFDRCDVALVIGANDVTYPAASRPRNPRCTACRS